MSPTHRTSAGRIQGSPEATFTPVRLRRATAPPVRRGRANPEEPGASPERIAEALLDRGHAKRPLSLSPSPARLLELDARGDGRLLQGLRRCLRRLRSGGHSLRGREDATIAVLHRRAEQATRGAQ